MFAMSVLRGTWCHPPESGQAGPSPEATGEDNESDERRQGKTMAPGGPRAHQSLSNNRYTLNFPTPDESSTGSTRLMQTEGPSGHHAKNPRASHNHHNDGSSTTKCHGANKTRGKISEDLTRSLNTSRLVKKAQQHFFIRRTLRRNRFPPQTADQLLPLHYESIPMYRCRLKLSNGSATQSRGHAAEPITHCFY
ncbi:unnamed protein product [Lota lota]